MQYFIVGNSFAAPFCSDTMTSYVEASTPEAALQLFVDQKPHPFGIYSADAYGSADDYHQRKRSLAVYRCNLVLAKERVTKGLGCFTYMGRHDGFEVDNVRYRVQDPQEGRVLPKGYEAQIEQYAPMPRKI